LLSIKQSLSKAIYSVPAYLDSISKRNVEQWKRWLIANHAWRNMNHRIDFENGVQQLIKETIGADQHLNHGTLQQREMLTIIQNIYQNNIVFYSRNVNIFFYCKTLNL
jgi:hypothetical protein